MPPSVAFAAGSAIAFASVAPKAIALGSCSQLIYQQKMPRLVDRIRGPADQSTMAHSCQLVSEVAVSLYGS